MISTKFEILQKKYDMQVRKKCNESKYLVESCLQEHFDDQYVCKPYIEIFEKCVTDFTVKFKKETGLN